MSPLTFFYWKIFLFTKAYFPCFALIKIFNSNNLIVTYSNKLDACPFENIATEYCRLQCENINENNCKQPFHLNEISSHKTKLINCNLIFSKIIWIANEKLVILKMYLSHSTTIFMFDVL